MAKRVLPMSVDNTESYFWAPVQISGPVTQTAQYIKDIKTIKPNKIWSTNFFPSALIGFPYGLVFLSGITLN